MHLFYMIKTLNPIQKKALKELVNGKSNLFLSGLPGAGKSHVIKLYREIVKQTTQETIPMLASTGAAAVLVKGVTFTSFFGLGILAGGVDNTVANAMKNYTVVERIIFNNTIIVDEVSMISAEFLKAANLLCQKVRKNKKFMGGIRVIMVGDFFQLGPFSDNEKPSWAFLGACWKQGKMKNIHLTQVMRTQDKTFLEVLSKVRVAKIDAKVKKFLNQKLWKKKIEDFDGTILFSRLHEVETYNQKKLSAIKEVLHTSKTQYVGDNFAIERMKETLVVGEEIQYKRGALVMFRVNNQSEGYINGTLGHIVSISPDVLGIKKLDGQVIQLKKHIFEYCNGNGEVVAKAKNFPIILAWAVTIHKAQGTSLDKALISLDRLWLHGQAYTALSRMTNVQGLAILNWTPGSFIVDKKVVKAFGKK